MSTAAARRRLFARVEHVESQLQALIEGKLDEDSMQSLSLASRASRRFSGVAPKRLSAYVHDLRMAKNEEVHATATNRVDDAVWRLIADQEDEVMRIVQLGEQADQQKKEEIQHLSGQREEQEDIEPKDLWKAGARSQHVRDGKYNMAIRNAKFEAQGSMPAWVRRLSDTVFLLDHFGFSADTWWRPRFLGELDAVEDTLKKYEERQTPVTRQLLASIVQCRLEINTLTARQLINRVHDMLLLAEDIDNEWGAKMRAHRKLHTDWMSSRQAYRKELHELSANRVHKVGVQGPKFGFYKASAMPLVPLPTRGSLQARKLAAAQAVLAILDKVEQLPVNQHTENEIYGDYLALLATCAQQGLWHISIPIYHSLWKNLRHRVSLDTYRLIITACKHASPCNSVQAIQVLAEVRQQGFTPDVMLFNAIIDACVPKSEWRSAARLVRVMANLNIAATPVTYDTLYKVCAKAPLDHAPLIYETMKLAGVPETIAFACARSNLYKSP